ncbi:MAG: methyl-accepting chemotaxis protein, partial [Betaproteobacteria bacterium]|nr:methyl-accepting chemotaxis protein [Betaproteobacteria bacterium]
MKNAPRPSRNLSVLRNLAVRTRLVIGFGSIVGLLAISAVLGVWELQSIEKAVARMEERDLIAERAVGDLRLATQANLARVLAVTLSDAVEIAAPFSLKIGETELEISALLVKIDGILESSREKAALAEVVAKRGAFLGARLEAVRARDAGDAAEGIRLATQRMNPAAEAYAASQAQLATVVAQVRAERAFKAQRATDAGRWLLIAFAALGATAGLVLGAMIAKSISSPISFVIRTSEQLATGDLRERITAQSRSEFGRMISALEEMRAQFSNSIRAIQEATHVVGQEAKQVARGSADLATRTEEQASTF